MPVQEGIKSLPRETLEKRKIKKGAGNQIIKLQPNDITLNSPKAAYTDN